MIKVKYDGKYSLFIEGHAGQAPHGQDIVCASVSALICTLAEYLAKHSGHLVQHKISTSSGKGIINVVPEKYFESSCAAAFEFTLSGLSNIAENYPDYIRFMPL